MARRKSSGDYSYTRTAMVCGHEDDGRYAVILQKRDHSRVVKRLPDGSAPGEGIKVQTSDVFDLKPTRVIETGQRGTITLPGEFRRDLGIEEGTLLEIIQEEDGRLSIRPLSPIPTEGHAVELNDLVNRITPENLHGEVSTGEAVGRESW
jgi:antitoxin MazE